MQIDDIQKLSLGATGKILKSNGSINIISNVESKNVLVIKPNFGCSTKKIYSKVKKFNSSKFKASISHSSCSI